MLRSKDAAVCTTVLKACFMMGCYGEGVVVNCSNLFFNFFFCVCLIFGILCILFDV